MRKVTKIWKQKDGTKIRICDMSDSYLQNAMKMLERAAHQQEQSFVLAACPFQGDMASFTFEQEQNRVLEEGLDVEEVYPVYDDLFREVQRRNLTI